MKYLTWSVFTCIILTSFSPHVEASRKLDQDSAFNKVLNYVKLKWQGGATHNDGRNHVFDYEEKEEWKDFHKTPEYKKALKNYLDRVLSPRGMDAKAINLKGVNIIALTPHKEKETSIENDNQVTFIAPFAEHSDEKENNINFKSLLDASNEKKIPHVQNLDDENSNVKSIQLRNWRASDLKRKAKSAISTRVRNLFNIQMDQTKHTNMYGINFFEPRFNSEATQNKNKNDKTKRHSERYGRAGRKQDAQLIILRPRLPFSKNDDSLRRTVFSGPGEVILGAPTRPEHLPKAMPILPGHTLLRPAKGMLKSAVKYPLRDVGGSEVYGNLNNLGITFGKTRSRVQYTDFRRSDDFLQKLQKSIQNSRSSGKTRPLILIALDTDELEKIKLELKQDLIKKQLQDTEENDNGSEIFDDLEVLHKQDNKPTDFRRRKIQKKNSKFRDRGKYYLRKPGSDSDSSDSTDDSSDEKNPGNPFTIHKHRYKQNWMWNHKMDGTHMNVNPYAPNMNQFGPTGAELFFARKWWYFNQDDYKPLGRKR